MSSLIHHPRRQAIVEIALIFAVFCIHGAWPVPDVNESYYLGKAIHFWNSDWLSGDFFLESADAHAVFYYTFGWLSLWLRPTALAWTGRAICWLLLAWSWRRLSFAAVPRSWWSALTAALFVCLMERFHMAGEWVVGGVEAKPFAYALVFLGLEAILRNRWNRGLLLMGVAAAFHPLVGGWSAVAAGFAWLRLKFIESPSALTLTLSQGKRGPIDNLPSPFGRGAGSEGNASISRTDEEKEPPSALTLTLSQREREPVSGRGFVTPPLRSLWPGILGGFILALPGLIPSLMLDWGADAETARQAHLLYVFERLPHHLVLSGIYREFILRMSLLACFWLLLGIWRRRLCDAGVPPAQCSRDDRATIPLDALRAFVAGAIAIALTGAAIHLLIPLDEALAAGLLRFYWFRLIDAALPLGVALESVALIVGLFDSCGRRLPSPNSADIPASIGDGSCLLQNKWEPSPFFPRCWLALAVVVAAFHLGDRTIDRIASAPPRSHKLAGFKEESSRRADFDDWRAACEWIARSGEIPPDATFIVPRLSATLRWYAGRREVVSWKDVPQSAGEIVEWRRRVQDIYGTGLPPDEASWFEPLAIAGGKHLAQVAEKYRAGYAITDRTTPPLDFPILYENRTYVVYQLGK